MRRLYYPDFINPNTDPDISSSVEGNVIAVEAYKKRIEQDARKKCFASCGANIKERVNYEQI